jgi:hypothetical protein
MAVTTALGAGTADADVTQLGDAIRINAVDIAGYTAKVVATNLAAPDTTCPSPVVVGVPVTPAARNGYGEVYGNDAVVAHGDCVSATGRSYLVTITIWLQYQPASGAAFVDLRDCGPKTQSESSVNGVAAVTSPVLQCGYTVDSPAYGKPHRAYAVLTNSDNPNGLYENAGPIVWTGGVQVDGSAQH